MAVILEIKVIPSSGRQDLFRDKSGSLKCHLKNPPENGKANAELIKMLAKNLGLGQNAVQLLSGATARKKIIKIESSLSLEELLRELGIESQTTLAKG
ncbi:MAG: DUF167 domain-containing protein [Candidatus Babeliales bacterium]|jgi:hypothetical protein